MGTSWFAVCRDSQRLSDDFLVTPNLEQGIDMV